MLLRAAWRTGEPALGDRRCDGRRPRLSGSSESEGLTHFAAHWGPFSRATNHLAALLSIGSPAGAVQAYGGRGVEVFE